MRRNPQSECGLEIWIGFGLQFEAYSSQLEAPEKQTAGPTPCRSTRFVNLGPYFPLPTAFFNSFPGVNLATRRAGILIVAPVCGLRPLRALR